MCGLSGGPGGVRHPCQQVQQPAGSCRISIHHTAIARQKVHYLAGNFPNNPHATNRFSELPFIRHALNPFFYVAQSSYLWQ